jgi:hypothetical protein
VAGVALLDHSILILRPIPGTSNKDGEHPENFSGLALMKKLIKLLNK